VNLVHYTGLRQHDLRELQNDLMDIGATSLATTEADVRAKVRVARSMCWQPFAATPAHGIFKRSMTRWTTRTRSSTRTRTRSSRGCVQAGRPEPAQTTVREWDRYVAGELIFIPVQGNHYSIFQTESALKPMGNAITNVLC
jgi:hypothetical protein